MLAPIGSMPAPGEAPFDMGQITVKNRPYAVSPLPKGRADRAPAANQGDDGANDLRIRPAQRTARRLLHVNQRRSTLQRRPRFLDVAHADQQFRWTRCTLYGAAAAEAMR